MIRKATIKDVIDISKIRKNSWQVTYKGIMPDEFLKTLEIEKMAEYLKELFKNPKINTYVYEENEILGFITFAKSEEDENIGEIYAIYLRPDKKRMGIGSKLFNYAKGLLKEKGYDKMIIWCAKGNSPSIIVYDKMGGN
jgi:ribosomal protein S18 acetylase RimI-like enzyme